MIKRTANSNNPKQALPVSIGFSLQHAVYTDLINKENNGTQLSDAEKSFMKKLEEELAQFYSDTK